MKFVELKKHLSAGVKSGAYLITGDDAYVVRSAVELFKNTVSIMPQLNICNLYENTEAQKIIEECEVLPMMDEHRLVFVFDFSKDCEKLVGYLKMPNPSTVLVFVSPVLKENLSKLVPLLAPVDCNRLDTESLIKFIAKKVSQYKSEISLDAAKLLIEYCSSDLSRINGETEKLASLKLDGKITPQDVQELVSPDMEFQLYDFSDAVSVKNNEKAAKILRSFLEKKIDPTFILGALYSHFRRLLFCLINSDSSSLPALLNVKEYAVKKSVAAAAKYSPVRLKRICDNFHFADFSYKSGNTTAILALEVYVMQILSEK